MLTDRELTDYFLHATDAVRARSPDTSPEKLIELLPTHLGDVLANPALPLLMLECPALALAIEDDMAGFA